MSIKFKKYFLIVCLFFLFIIYFQEIYNLTPISTPIVVNYIRTVDGDTIVVMMDGVLEKVRLIGVDTPETVSPKKPIEYYGIEQTYYTKSVLTNLQEIYLTFDLNLRDYYNRLLQYVWIKNLNEWTLLNYNIIYYGFGIYYNKFKFNNFYMDQFYQQEKIAIENNIGVWQKNN